MGVVLTDTRQHAGKHDQKHGDMSAAGFEPAYTKLYVGDYQMPAAVAVDTKASIAELASNIDREHDRFRRELIRAQEAGTRLVILVENVNGVTDLETLSKWIEPLKDFRRRKYAVRRLYGSRLAKACATMQKKYGCEFAFCHPCDTGRKVLELLGVLDADA